MAASAGKPMVSSASAPGPSAAVPPADDPRVLRRRYDEVKARIADAAKRAGRTTEGVVLVAVTKNASIDQIRRLIEFGHTDFGENRVQNLLQRMAQVDEFLQRHRELGVARAGVPERVRWHMIGHLQRNKARKVAGLVRLVHSVDSLRLIEELHACAARQEEPIELLIQVNVAGERQKQGVAPAAVSHLIEQIDTMIGLTPRGIMCLAPISERAEDSRVVFERCRELFEEIQRQGVGGEKFDILSMGMSGDYEVAVECGANIVRVGSAIFGHAPSTAADEDEDGAE